MRCIETQKNNTGFEKWMWNITGSHTDTDTATHTHTQTILNLSTHFLLVWKVA